MKIAVKSLAITFTFCHMDSCLEAVRFAHLQQVLFTFSSLHPALIIPCNSIQRFAYCMQVLFFTFLILFLTLHSDQADHPHIKHLCLLQPFSSGFILMFKVLINDQFNGPLVPLVTLVPLVIPVTSTILGAHSRRLRKQRQQGWPQRNQRQPARAQQPLWRMQQPLNRFVSSFQCHFGHPGF